MTKSPKSVSREQIRQLHETLQCDARLDGADTKIEDYTKFSPEETAQSGIVEWQLITRKSLDGSVDLLADIYIHEDGKIQMAIVVLEVDGQIYYPSYDQPSPIGGGF